MVEFALVLPIILLLLFGMLQFALVLNARQTVAYAAQAAASGYAQTLVRAQADGDAKAAAIQLRPDFGKAGKVEYRIVRAGNESPIAADGVGAFGDLVVARVTYDYPSPVRAGIAGFRFPDTLALTAEAVARIEAAGTSPAGGGGVATSPPLAPTPTTRPIPMPTPSPTPTAAATPTPTPRPAATPTPTPALARCFAYSDATVNMTNWTGHLRIDGHSPAAQRFAAARRLAAGTSHWISANYYYRAGWFRPRTYYGWVSGTFAVPASGTIGTQYTASASLGSRGSAVVRLTGITGTC